MSTHGKFAHRCMRVVLPLATVGLMCFTPSIVAASPAHANTSPATADEVECIDIFAVIQELAKRDDQSPYYKRSKGDQLGNECIDRGNSVFDCHVYAGAKDERETYDLKRGLYEKVKRKSVKGSCRNETRPGDPITGVGRGSVIAGHASASYQYAEAFDTSVASGPVDFYNLGPEGFAADRDDVPSLFWSIIEFMLDVRRRLESALADGAAQQAIAPNKFTDAQTTPN
jgi:hypothetical protein